MLNREQVVTCLQEALDQRAKIILDLPQEATSLRDINGTLEDFDNQYLYLLVTGLNKFNPDWKGMEIKCFFKLVQKTGSRREIFFNFLTMIYNIERDDAGYIKFVLPWPEKLDVGQRRAAMRIEPTLKFVLGFYLWPENRFLRTKTEQGKAALHSPKLTLDNIQNDECSIPDISAGGMKLRLSKRFYKNLDMVWEKQSSQILWLTLFDPAAGKNEEFWLKTRVKHMVDSQHGNAVDIGLEFTHFGQINEKKKMKWRKVKGHNVEYLDNWIYQRYIENFRQGLVQ